MSDLARDTIARQTREIERLRAEVQLLETSVRDYSHALDIARFKLGTLQARLGSIPRWVKGLYGVQ